MSAEGEPIRVPVQPRPQASLAHHLIEAAGVGLCLLDPGGRVLLANEEWLRSSKLRREDALGKDIWDLFPGTPPELRRLHDEVRAGRTVEVPPHRQRIDGREVSFEGRLAPVPLAEGGIGVLITACDVTRRENAEAELRHSEGRYRVLHESLRDAFVQVDMAGRLVEFNDVYREMLGYSAEELHALTYTELTPERWHAMEARIVEEQILGRGYSDVYEKEYRRKDGTLVPVELRTILTRDVSGRPEAMWAIIRDVTERKKVLEALRQADRQKDDFLAVLSHELRNPLAPIRNSIHLLEQAPPESEFARRAREVLRRQSDLLARLVDDLLDLTRISRGKIELRRIRLDAREVIGRACEDLRPAFEGSGVALQVAADPVPVLVHADAARLAQMAGNLLGNALKFTPAGGEVVVRVLARDGQCELSVRDTGAGIEAEDLSRIFAPFVQAERTRALRQGGLGIGLALVRELARMQGGEVEAHSEGRGRGAEFVLRLPLAEPLAQAAPAGVAAEAAARGCLEIVVVEDHADAAASLADLLTLFGHRVRVVGTGAEGLRAVTSTHTDVVLCDIGLPDMTGHEVAQALRAAGSRAFAVALTGYAQPQDRARALAAGFDAHVGKPPAVEELRALLRRAAEAALSVHEP